MIPFDLGEDLTIRDDVQTRLNLPEGWENPRFDEILIANYGKGLKKTKRAEGPVPVYGSNGVVGNHDVALTRGPTIILGRKGTVGAVHLSNTPCWPIDTTYYIDEFSGLDADYLLYSLRSLNLGELDTSTAIPGLNRDDLYRQRIPLPPVSEQERIAEKLKKLSKRVRQAKRRLNRVAQILRDFRQAILSAAYAGHLSADWRTTQSNLEPASELVARIRKKCQQEYEIQFKEARKQGKRVPKKPAILEDRKIEATDLPDIPDCWTWVLLPALGLMNRGRSQHRPRDAPHLYGGPYPFIQTGDIAQSGGRVTSHRQTYSEAGLAQSRLWPADTVCITIAANIANSAILTYPACFPDSVVGLVPNKGLCVPEYVEFFIRTARADLDSFAPATAQKNINIAILSDVAVPLPPFGEQCEIVTRIGSLFKLADAIERNAEKANFKIEQLSQAVLLKAVRGELVPTEAELARREGRNYETASELLQSIRSKHSFEVKRATKKRKKRVTRPRKDLAEMLQLENLPEMHLAQILRKHGKPMTPEALWRSSQLSIDDFYAQLKKEIDRGSLRESRINDSERLLELAE